MFKAICCGAVLAAVHAAGQGIEREFSIATGGELVVVADNAKLDVRGSGEAGIVQVSIQRGDDGAENIEEDYDIAFDVSDETLRIYVERRSPQWQGWFGNRRHWRSLSITVKTPFMFNADLKTSGGSVRVSDLGGTVSAKTSGGSMRFDNVDGHVAGQTSGGSIRLLGTSSNVDLATSGGSIAVAEVQGVVRTRTSGGKITIDHAAGPVYAKTSGGGIEIKMALDAVEARTSGGSIAATFAGQPSRESKLVTSGGSVRIGMTDKIGFDIDAKASGGSVGLSDGLTFSGNSTRRSLSGSVNGGGPRLTLRTSGGSIKLLPLMM